QKVGEGSRGNQCIWHQWRWRTPRLSQHNPALPHAHAPGEQTVFSGTHGPPPRFSAVTNLHHSLITEFLYRGFLRYFREAAKARPVAEFIYAVFIATLSAAGDH